METTGRTNNSWHKGDNMRGTIYYNQNGIDVSCQEDPHLVVYPSREDSVSVH